MRNMTPQVHAALAGIDGLALILTRRRDHFHVRGTGCMRADATPHGGSLCPRVGNLFENLPGAAVEEKFTTLAKFPSARIERIVSTGQASPTGLWYDHEQAEWVVLLNGSASVMQEGKETPRVPRPGEDVEIPARKKHRVEWTDPKETTVWLAAHADG
jgi:cupin 2 domain-containing protein